MPITTLVEPSGLIVAHLSGVLQREEVDAAKRDVFGFLMTRGASPLLMHVNEGFAGLQNLVQWDDIPEDKFIQQHVTRLAFVGDLRWRDTALLFFFHNMVPFQMEYFPEPQYELAVAWLTAP
jgi:hypothetical protein